MSTYQDIFDQALKRREESRQNFINENKENRKKCRDMSDTMINRLSKDGEIYRQYLDMQDTFSHYTPNNVLLIMAQKPDATQIGNYQYWRDHHVSIKKEERGNPILILEPGDKYTRLDHSVGTYYNAKQNYDISQTTAKWKPKPRPVYDLDKLMACIAASSPVPITRVDPDTLPAGTGALYDPSTDSIKLHNQLESGTTIFQCVTMEMSHALMAQGDPQYDRDVHGLKALSASYLLCKRYGVDTKAYNFDGAEQLFPDMDNSEIKQELFTIKRTAQEISKKMDRELRHYEAQRQSEAR